MGHEFARGWQRYLAIGTASMAVTLIAAYLITIGLDPFGRLGIVKSHGIGFQEERPSMVSRALDQQFNSAIIGNSSSIPLMPKHLDELSGERFVSLSISGSEPPASISTLKFFLAHHSHPKVVVIALMYDAWCVPSFDEHRSFPFWLYSDLPHYFWGLAKNTSLDLIKTTLVDRRALKSVDAHRNIALDGYHTLSGPFLDPKYTDPKAVKARLNIAIRPQKSPNPGNVFPALDQLVEVLRMPSPAFYVVLWTPHYIRAIAAPGSAAEETDRACKAALAKPTSHIPNVKVLDWSDANSPENSDPDYFFDPIHYRRPLAERLEEAIDQAIPATLKGR
jgi:hypothetical protein